MLYLFREAILIFIQTSLYSLSIVYVPFLIDKDEENEKKLVPYKLIGPYITNK